jgi:hypothetical protein
MLRALSPSNMAPLARQAGHTGIRGNTTVAHLSHRLPIRQGVCSPSG